MRIELTAWEDQTQVDSTSLEIQILHDPFEQQNPFPNHDLLKQVAAASGGQVLTRPAELADVLNRVPKNVGPPVIKRSPLWSGWWLWGLIVGLLTIEGLLAARADERVADLMDDDPPVVAPGVDRERAAWKAADHGEGRFVDLRPHGFPYEPTVQEVVAAGVDVVTFSGDKLLGGPQAGIVVGKSTLVSRLKKNPLNRALRIDKLTLAALEATLYAYEASDPLVTVPTLRTLTEPLDAVRARAQRLLRLVPEGTRSRMGARVVEDEAQVGGGALPTVVLPTAAVAVGTAELPARALDEALRLGDPAVIGRIADDRLLLDCRTVLTSQVTELSKALGRVAGER